MTFMALKGSGSSSPLRFGILGAARIAPMALIRPARRVAQAHVVAVAARDVAKARAFAAKHGIARVHESYDALLADTEIDAIYNPLPNGLHCEWTIRALRAGKDVLCEKPSRRTLRRRNAWPTLRVRRVAGSSKPSTGDTTRSQRA